MFRGMTGVKWNNCNSKGGLTELLTILVAIYEKGLDN